MLYLNIRNSLNLYTQKTIGQALIFYGFWLIVFFIFTVVIGVILGVAEILDESNIIFISKLIPTLIITLIAFQNLADE